MESVNKNGLSVSGKQTSYVLWMSFPWKKTKYVFRKATEST